MLEKELHFPKDCTSKREANMSLDDMEMKTDDLLEKEQIDSGGFGMVSLCFHRNHGLVILKNVYTGPKRNEYNAALLEEGKIMHKLKHNRVVKFLGFILEDGNYSLVMEYMEKGNLMKVLKTTSIPLSVKGRIILEIIEGMCYLHQEGVIHKDLKPENILVDDDFHVKVLARDSTTSGVLVLPSGCLLLNELLGTWSCLQSSQPRSQPRSPPESLKSSGRTKVKMT